MPEDVDLELHYGEDLTTNNMLLGLQSVLAEMSPRLFATLEVHAYERDRDRIIVDPTTPSALKDAVIARGTSRGETYDALVAADPAPVETRRFGSVLLRGRGRGTGGGGGVGVVSVHASVLEPGKRRRSLRRVGARPPSGILVR